MKVEREKNDEKYAVWKKEFMAEVRESRALSVQ
jgi:hypothetical protein